MTEAETRIAAALARTEGRRQVTLRREDALWMTGMRVIAASETVGARAEVDRLSRALITWKRYADKWSEWAVELQETRLRFWPAWSMAAGLAAMAALGGWLVGHG